METDRKGGGLEHMTERRKDAGQCNMLMVYSPVILCLPSFFTSSASDCCVRRDEVHRPEPRDQSVCSPKATHAGSVGHVTTIVP